MGYCCLNKRFEISDENVTNVRDAQPINLDICHVYMRSISAVSFLVLYGLAMIRPAFPLIDYYIELEEYKRNCINKTKPEMHCNGQCILMQKLKAFSAQEQEPAAPAPVKINFEDYPIAICEEFVPATSLLISSNDFENSLPPPFFIGHYISDIFRPPSFRV
jgi:hypothetical protein